MSESLKSQTVRGVAWSSVEKIFTYLVTFVVNIVMARLLTPADYGVVGIIAVFVSFSQLFIDGGFTTALISKANRDEADYRTVFVFNVISSIILYAVIFFAAPVIESYYEISELGWYLRANSLVLIISALSAVQITKFTIDVDFKTISKISVPSSIVSGIVGIVMAYCGCGIWSIVAQHLSAALLRTLMAIIISKWMPKVEFSYDRFKQLFSFSSKLVASSLIDRIYTNSFPLFIGKVFPPATLGNYTRGDQFGKLPSGILEDIFNRVTFPLMSKIQNDVNQLKGLYRKYIKMSSFIIFPILMLVVVLSEPLVRLLLTDKWLGCVPFMQIISMAVMANHIGTINRNLLYVKQHSDWALRLEIVKKIIAIGIFVASTKWGIWGVCVGQWIYGMIAPSLNAFYTQKLIGMNLWQQLRDYLGLWLVAVLSAILPLWLISQLSSAWVQLFLGTITYCGLYLLINIIAKSDPLLYIWQETRAFFENSSRGR